MRKILVLGGTRFFGLQLVRLLTEQGDQVTVASRNFDKVPRDLKIRKITFDRENPSSFAPIRDAGDFDLIYDQLCYTPNNSKTLLEELGSSTKRIVMTSTQSVYVKDGSQEEEDFDPSKYPVRYGDRVDFSYSEGKRLAEAVLAQQFVVPVAFARLPLVLGNGDYTGRLDFHVRSVLHDQLIVAENPEAQTSIISDSEAAEFLNWLGRLAFEGPLNAASSGHVSLEKIVGIIAEQSGKTTRINPSGLDSEKSPYAQANARWLDTKKAKSLGFQFSLISDWLPILVRDRLQALA